MMTSNRLSRYSRYVRTTWRLSAYSTLPIPECDAKIRFLSKAEATTLSERARKGNPFLRHADGNQFYLNRMLNLGDKTVIEIYKLGKPAQVGPTLHPIALLIETTVLLSTTLSIQRPQLHKCLAIDQDRGSDYDMVIGPQFKSFRSRSKRQRQLEGIPIDAPFIKRFQRNGFQHLLKYCQSNSDLSTKVISTLGWLADSRQEPRLTAAIVKSSIALESLLIFNENESLARSLSERCAFLLTPHPETRQRVSQIIRRFYDARSGIVHGGRHRNETISPKLLETVDRLVLLVVLVLSNNGNKWPNRDSLQKWCEFQKWDAPDKTVVYPFAKRHLQVALRMSPST